MFQRLYNTERKKYTSPDKINAAMAYILCGNVAQAAKMVRVSDTTFRNWVSQPWWASAIEYARRIKMGELHGKLTEIIDLAVAGVKERLERGDEVIDAKTGSIRHKAISARDSAYIATLFMEKREIAERITIPDASKVQADNLVDVKQELEDEHIH